MTEPFDLNAILGQAMEMQTQLAAAQAEAANAEVTGRAGGGAVAITVTGGLDFRRVEIRPDAVDPDDVDMLQDLVLAALNDAMDQLGALQQASLGGLDLGGLGGLGGDPGAPGAGGFDLGALMSGLGREPDDDGDDDEAGADAPGGDPRP